MDASRTYLSTVRRADCWIFDLDNTLYPSACNLFGQIDLRMRDFIATLLGVSPEEAYKVQKSLFREYGTTMRGLMDTRNVPPRIFLDYVHDIDLSPVPHSPDLDAALSALPGRKAIYTNADSRHAGRVLDRLGVAHHFEVIFDIFDADLVPKPHPKPYDQVVDRLNIDPAKAVMVEDMARNLAPAAALGMTTVWVQTGSDWGKPDAAGDYVHHQTDDLVSWLQAVLAA